METAILWKIQMLSSTRDFKNQPALVPCRRPAGFYGFTHSILESLGFGVHSSSTDFVLIPQSDVLDRMGK